MHTFYCGPARVISAVSYARLIVVNLCYKLNSRLTFIIAVILLI